MTISELNNIIRRNNIPDDAKLMSNSGWECDATEMDGVWYNEATNIIIFTQGDYVLDNGRVIQESDCGYKGYKKIR